jgi:hypothetical protein
MSKMTAVLNKQKSKVVCTACGSEAVLVNAWEKWDAAKQRWQLADIFESNAYCANCECECSIAEQCL